MPAELRAYQPSLREDLAWKISGGLGDMFGLGRYGRQDIANKAQTLMDFIPGVGETLGADDVAGAVDAGNYRNAAFNLGAMMLGAMPVVGDVAGKAAKNYAYHRFTRGANPDNGIGYMMFAEGNPEKVSHYGNYHWGVDPSDIPQGALADASDEAFQRDLASMLHDNWDDVSGRGYGHASPELLAAESAPGDIIDSAGFWDSDLVDLAWEKLLDPRGIAAVKTPNGLISFDPSFVHRLSGGD